MPSQWGKYPECIVEVEIEEAIVLGAQGAARRQEREQRADAGGCLLWRHAVRKDTNDEAQSAR